MTPEAAPLSVLVAHLDALLRIREVPDEPNAVNGLQVECRSPVRRIVAAVDASQATIDGVAERAGPGTLLLVHHGLLWDGNVPVVDRRYRRLRALLENDIALYAAHIPLDVHPELGNNAVLAAKIGVEVEGWFGNYRGIPLGICGRLSLDREQLTGRLSQLLSTAATLIPGGPEVTARIGIVTGAGTSLLAAARDAGIDTFITGEGPHHVYFDAMEWSMNLLYGGHYATEKLGVQYLAEHLGERFGLAWEFHDHDTGL
ncbi:MAG: Nif3-like dinuclear metal center hexameric protein [Gemmatimonadota bacterium]